MELKKQTCENAVLFLAGKCDGAKSWDEQGFSKWDAEFGHSLANAVIKYGRLSPGQLRGIQRVENRDGKNGLLWKYRKQLERAGFDLEVLLDQPPVGDAESTGGKFERDVVQVSFDACLGDTSTGKSWKFELKGVMYFLPKKLVTVNGECVAIGPRWLFESRGLENEIEEKEYE